MKWIKASDRQPEDWDRVIVCEVYEGRRSAFVNFTNESYQFLISKLNPRPDCIDAIEWLDETPIDIAAIISEVEDMHPYKQSGNRESYSQYNEGWADACDILGNRIMEALGLPKPGRPVSGIDNYLNELIEKAGKVWKDVDTQKYLDMVKGREEE